MLLPLDRWRCGVSSRESNRKASCRVSQICRSLLSPFPPNLRAGSTTTSFAETAIRFSVGNPDVPRNIPRQIASYYQTILIIIHNDWRRVKSFFSGDAETEPKAADGLNVPGMGRILFNQCSKLMYVDIDGVLIVVGLVLP